MPSVLRLARLLCVAVAVAVVPASRPAAGAPTARLAAIPTSGTAPLVVAFDSAGSSAGTIAEHLLLFGSGDASTLGLAEQRTNYNYTLPGFYLAQTWLRDESGVALSPPVAIAASRQRDGLSPPTASVSVAATTDPTELRVHGDGDAAAGRRDRGAALELRRRPDRAASPAPFHAYAQPGVYQAALLATTRAGLPLYGRVVVVVGGADGALPPSLLLTASPGNASLLTPVTVTAYLEGVAPDAKLAGVEVAWPDFVDASPTVTPTASRA